MVIVVLALPNSLGVMLMAVFGELLSKMVLPAPIWASTFMRTAVTKLSVLCSSRQKHLLTVVSFQPSKYV